MNKEKIVEIICWILGIGIGAVILMKYLPYIMVFMVGYAAYQMYDDHCRNKRR